MISIHFECDDFLVAIKEAGIDFHDGEQGDGFFTQLKKQFPDQKLYPVHRLDKPTTGLILAAKNLDTCNELNQLFEKHEIQKYYLAISDRKPKKKQGWVIGDMQRSRRKTWKLLTSKKNPAITQFFSKSIGPNLRAFLLKPHTGRTHQLRVALKAIGSPICGDELYYPDAQKKDESRCYLHAYALKFELKSESFNFMSVPGGDYYELGTLVDELKQSWKNPWLLNWP